MLTSTFKYIPNIWALNRCLAILVYIYFLCDLNHLIMSNRGGGREQDSIWLHYEQTFIPSKKGNCATCKSCCKQMMGLTDRMKPNFEECNGDNDIAASPTTFSLRSLQPTESLSVLTVSPLPAVKKQKNVSF
ncbi:unnamed protein product [Meganyctiphanes norvegica]|uniref:Uncharacterized protein n=1 Tax=Meganyctiphanes norvegica TaxID=48144 RepID=A0AAV2SBQ9_MEGNR